MIKCSESGQGASINAYHILRNWSLTQTKGLQSVLKTPIWKNKVRIYRLAGARLTAYMLLG